MQIITGFETEHNEGPTEAQVINEDFIKVFKALEHDREVAENAFTRASKRAFKKYTEGGCFLEAKNARELRPTWVSEASVVLTVNGFDEAAQASELQQVVMMLGKAFESTLDDASQAALIEPLKCTITMITDKDAKFTIKQMWAPHE